MVSTIYEQIFWGDVIINTQCLTFFTKNGSGKGIK